MGTALVCIQTVKEIEAQSSEVTAPLLIVHGELDVVTDPEGSRRLYETAASTDKTLHIYPGMWHQLIGEPPENVDKVFGEIYAWLDTHASQTSWYAASSFRSFHFTASKMPLMVFLNQGLDMKFLAQITMGRSNMFWS